MNQALAFGVLFAGGILLTKAVTGSSFSQIVSGHPGQVQTTGQNLLGNGVAGVGRSVAGAGGNIAPSGGTVVGGVTYGQLQQIGARHGWTGAQITDWANVIKSESNGTLTDTNPASGAYGIAQFINGPGEYATYGGDVNTVTGQLTAMANYIAQRYGNPSAAWTFHQANNSY